MADWWDLNDGGQQVIVNLEHVAFITRESRDRVRLTLRDNHAITVDAQMESFRGLVQPRPKVTS